MYSEVIGYMGQVPCFSMLSGHIVYPHVMAHVNIYAVRKHSSLSCCCVIAALCAGNYQPCVHADCGHQQVHLCEACASDHEPWRHRYDDLKNYSNERSLYLAQLRDSIEGPWQAWELSQIDVDALKALSLDEVRRGWRALACGIAHVGAHIVTCKARMLRKSSWQTFLSFKNGKYASSCPTHIYSKTPTSLLLAALMFSTC